MPALRPLIPLAACMILMDRDEDEVTEAVEDHTFEFAWDIAGEGAERRYLRIWRDSLLAVLNNVPPHKPDLGLTADGNPPERRSDAEVLERILPHRDIRTTELQRIFSCSQKHVQGLVDTGLLLVTKPRAVQVGPQAFSIVSRESVVHFLQSRRA